MPERFIVAKHPKNIGIWLLFDTEEKRCYPFTGEKNPQKAKALVRAKDPLVKKLGTVDYEKSWEMVLGAKRALDEELAEENK